MTPCHGLPQVQILHSRPSEVTRTACPYEVHPPSHLKRAAATF